NRMRAEIARDWTDGTDVWETPPRETAQAPTQPKKICIRSPDEILAMPHDKQPPYLGDKVLGKGRSLAISGVGGIGKSRLILQAFASFNPGRKWCGLETHAKGLRCLLFQTQNSTARLQADLDAIKRWAGKDWRLVEENLRIHTLETDDDLLLHLSDPENARC